MFKFYKLPCLGLGLITLAACGGTAAAEPKAADPVTVTVTAPAPPAPPAKVVTKTVNKVPQACIDALDDAEAVVATARKAIVLSVKWPDIAVRSFKAGLTADSAALGGITRDVKALNTSYVTFATDLAPQVASYNRHSTTCRAAK
jgi:hypothetical protein